jgi:protocatechuate 3,4-dioxygenase beta subunit
MKNGMLMLIAAAAMSLGATYGALQGPSGEAASGGKGAGPGATGAATAVLIPAGEPGEPLIVEGRVVTDDGKPVAGAPLYLYHTDIHGYYSEGGKDERNSGARNSRLRGNLKTDAEGRYQFRTIKPGQYPGSSGPPAHIHYEITPEQQCKQAFELIFEGDSRLTPEIRQRAAKHDFFILCAPDKDEKGNLRCRDADVILK